MTTTPAEPTTAAHGDPATPPGVRDRGGAWCVIGGGPHGLSALKALLQNGIDADGYEREADVGGNWNYAGENARVYESTHLISTKPFTQFPDFPMPDDYPDYPSHWQVHRYLRRYAEHFGLLDRIALSTEVVRAVPVEGTDQWDVTVRYRGTGEERTLRYAGVVVANGHNWWPKVPTYPGQDSFTGQVIHSADYKGAEILRGKRVLVVGAGNTGCDVAVESAQNARETYHSTRRGYYYNPKYAMGRPSDQTADLLLALRLPLALRRAAFKATLRLTVGDFTKFGLQKPDHKFFETHPIVNQQLVYYVGHGDIAPKPDVERIDGPWVIFTDGTSSEVDLIVFCTGYLAVFPFLDVAVLNLDGDHPQLARQIFTPGSPTLVVSGLIQPDSGQWTIAHWQGMEIATYARLRRDDPEAARRFYDTVVAEADRRFSGGTEYKDSTRHYYEIAHQDYLRALERDIHTMEAAQ
ncbi:MAG: NAD(P)-binding domain-containing protein [Candidatus Nanopelagicales bacterium]